MTSQSLSQCDMTYILNDNLKEIWIKIVASNNCWKMQQNCNMQLHHPLLHFYFQLFCHKSLALGYKSHLIAFSSENLQKPYALNKDLRHIHSLFDVMFSNSASRHPLNNNDIWHTASQSVLAYTDNYAKSLLRGFVTKCWNMWKT